MKTHDLKCHPRFYAGVDDGSRPFECRRNDRGFAVGDTLRLREFDPEYGYTGRECLREVTSLLDVEDGPWLAPGFVCLGLAQRDELDALISDNQRLLSSLNAEASARVAAEARNTAYHEVLEAYAAWEATLLCDNAAWPVDRAVPVFTEALWDSLLVLQAMRNAVLNGKHGWQDDQLADLHRGLETARRNVQGFLYGQTYCIRDVTKPPLQQTLWAGQDKDAFERQLGIEHMRYALNAALAAKKVA